MTPGKRNLIICLALCALIVGAGFVRAGYLRSQYNLEFEPSEERYREMAVSTVADIYAYDYEQYEFDFAESAEELVSRSDCVVRVRVRSELELLGRCILSTLDVVKTLSGDAPKSDKIFLYEPIVMSEEPALFEELPNLKGPLMVQGAANRLRPGGEYVVALKHMELAKGALSPEHEGRLYIYTDMLCSAFPCGKEPEYYKYASDDWDDDNPLRYKDVYDADYIGSSSILGSCRFLYEKMTEYFGQEAFE